MTKYKIKIQNTNQDNTPDILVAIGVQIEEACQLLETEKENSPEIENIKKYIEDLKAYQDVILQKIKATRLEYFKIQTTLLLKEFKKDNYLKNLEKALEVKPVHMTQNKTCQEYKNNIQITTQNEETTTNLQANAHLDIGQQNNNIIPITPVLNTFQEIPIITKEQISLLITNAGINNSDKRNFKLEIARLRLLYIMTFFSPLNTTQILGMKKHDFQEHKLAYLIINDNPELKRNFEYFFEKKVFISDSQKKNTHFINTRSYWVKVFNQDFYFFQEYYQTNTNFSLKDLKPFYYQLIAEFSADSQVFQKITNCSPFLIRKYSGQIDGSKSYETKAEKVYENIINFIGKIIDEN
jgi:hypothetical protein